MADEIREVEKTEETTDPVGNNGAKKMYRKNGVSKEKAIEMESHNRIGVSKKESWKARFTMPNRGFKVYFLRYAIIIPVLSFLVAASYYCFITPNHFAPGGIYGVGSMVEGKTGYIPMGAVVFVLSVPLIIGAFMVLDLESALNITLMAIFASAFSVLLTNIGFYQYKATELVPGVMDKVTKLFAAIIGGAFAGATFAYTIKIFGVADGTIALASIVKKKRPDVSIAWATFAFDAIVVASSIVVYWPEYTEIVKDQEFTVKLGYALEPIMYSVINMFMISKVCDVILRGIQAAYKFEVVTDKPEEISEHIIRKLGRGVTMISAKGMYSGANKALLICIVRKRQIGDFQRIVKAHSGSFAYMTSTSEVLGHFSK